MAKTKAAMREALKSGRPAAKPEIRRVRPGSDPAVTQIREVYRRMDNIPIPPDRTKILRGRVLKSAGVWTGPGHYMYEGRIHMSADCVDTPLAQHILVSCQEFGEPPLCLKLLDGFFMSYELTNRIEECPEHYKAKPGNPG